MMKRMIAVAATLVLTATAAFAAAENYTVGIGQFAEHGSLDNCRTGFVEGLAEAGLVEGDNLTILYQNAQADMGIAQQIAAQFAAKPVDLMVLRLRWRRPAIMRQAKFRRSTPPFPIRFPPVSLMPTARLQAR